MRATLIKTLWGMTMIIGLAPLPAAAASTAPSSVGGFILDRSIEEYPVEGHANYLSEVIFTDLKGYRKAFITYGACRNKGKILRIKLKYENRSFDFFKELLSRYREKFGGKPKFSGDQFGNVRAWKWSLTDDQGRRVNLELQHNLRDDEESIGNMVKLSLPDLLNDERLCFNELHDSAERTSEKADWEDLIPN
ncbi:MAG: hypothetical protein HKP52_00585 [Desulfofustis sp.]|nr:hypothetical protein [Desulfofustis sp.]